MDLNSYKLYVIKHSYNQRFLTSMSWVMLAYGAQGNILLVSLPHPPAVIIDISKEEAEGSRAGVERRPSQLSWLKGGGGGYMSYLYCDGMVRNICLAAGAAQLRASDNSSCLHTVNVFSQTRSRNAGHVLTLEDPCSLFGYLPGGIWNFLWYRYTTAAIKNQWQHTPINPSFFLYKLYNMYVDGSAAGRGYLSTRLLRMEPF